MESEGDAFWGRTEPRIRGDLLAVDPCQRGRTRCGPGVDGEHQRRGERRLILEAGQRRDHENDIFIPHRHVRRSWDAVVEEPPGGASHPRQPELNREGAAVDAGDEDLSAAR